ncbi:MAG: hypothetical protein J0I32_08890 [Sphingobacteriales bacterium]|nr:hypothetical protein [Sphingobacteriales bacterium]OJW00115.1 MAG: hypothetical protein BGO52_03235 [Sphingobacteriales bacterium 44-61]
MFQSISWSQFITAALLLIILYYIIVGVLYYRREFREKLQRLRSGRTNTRGDADHSPPAEQFSQATELKATIEEVLHVAVNRAWIKHELLMELRRRVAPYLSLQQTPFEFAINNHIIQQVELRCNIRLEPDDLRVIWT